MMMRIILLLFSNQDLEFVVILPAVEFIFFPVVRSSRYLYGPFILMILNAFLNSK